MSGDDIQRDMEEEPTYSEFWPMTTCIIGIILLFLALGECSSHFSLDGDNHPESNYTTEFCYGGCFFLLLGVILSANVAEKKEKAKLEKMTEEEKQLYIKEKKEKEIKHAIYWFIFFLITLFTLIILIP